MIHFFMKYNNFIKITSKIENSDYKELLIKFKNLKIENFEQNNLNLY